MAFEEGLECISRPTAADFTAVTNLWTGVKYNAAGALVPFAAATDRPAGVLQKPLPKNLDVARLAVGGITKVKLGGTVSGGDTVQFNATGLGILAVAGGYVIGTAITAGVTGDVIPVSISAANPPIK